MKNTLLARIWPALALGTLLLGLPLLGVTLAGQPVVRYLEFPPRTHYVAHAPFAWPAFAGLAIFIAIALLPLVGRIMGHVSLVIGSAFPCPLRPSPPVRFPAFGYVGLALTAAAWRFAWTRWPWFAPYQDFTFSPIWFGYILTINALTYRRSGHCMLRDRPRFLLALFPVSAAFWWFFEYLNRFVQNWYYVGVGELSGFQYALFATLPFATVLPAVLGTDEWLATFPRLGVGLARYRPLRLARPRRWAALALLVTGAGLAGIGVWPDVLFPLLWVSPLAIITAIQSLRRRPTLFAPLATGDWRRLVRLALAALLCGFFWEMWNFNSAAKWIYAVPFVNRFHLFEMPLLGFAGYLPFGLECAVVGDAVAAWLKCNDIDTRTNERSSPHAHPDHALEPMA